MSKLHHSSCNPLITGVGMAIVILLLWIGFQQITEVLLNQSNKAVIIYNETIILIYFLYILHLYITFAIWWSINPVCLNFPLVYEYWMLVENRIYDVHHHLTVMHLSLWNRPSIPWQLCKLLRRLQQHSVKCSEIVCLCRSLTPWHRVL
jgi:hypothetical protein